ncbi:MAG: metallophosphoesterase [Planctomyces sp.]
MTAGSKPVRILQITDLHVFADPEAQLKGIPTRKTLQDVVQYIVEKQFEFDFLVITGDHTHDELPQSYQAVRSILAPWHSRLFQVPGNHDDRAVLRDVFADRMNADSCEEKINFAFDAGKWLCLGLDTHLPGEVAGQIDESQITWIRKQIAGSPEASVVLFMHHPPVVLNSIWMDRIGLNGRELLTDLIRNEPRIRLVCCGHVHHESTRTVTQSVVVTTPSTGIQFVPEGDTATFERAAPGFRLIELRDDNFMTRVFRLPEARWTPE